MAIARRGDGRRACGGLRALHRRGAARARRRACARAVRGVAPGRNASGIVGRSTQSGDEGSGKMFDYVIVGAGSAGCVLASRLSEDPDVQVLLLEAGPPDTKENVHVPLGYLKLAGPDVDWDYHSAPERACAGRRIQPPRREAL